MHAFIKKCFFLGRTNIWPAIRFGAISFLTASVIAGCSAPLLQDEVLQSSVDEPANDGSSARMRLITSEQYLNTLAHTFGPSIDLGSKFPPLQRTKGLLANGAATAGVTAAQLEQYQRTAASVASQVVDNEHRNFLISCKPENEKAADQECAAEFLAEAGRLLYRRPLSEIQIKEAAEKASIAGNDLEDFYTGLAIALEGMLISPEMLFIVETVEPDPVRPGQTRLDAYSLASRMSFFLWNAGPDGTLIDAAESGEIQTVRGRTRIVDMMLASPRLELGVRAFFDDMFAFDDFDTLAKDPLVYPSFTGVTVVDAREQTLRTVVDHLITKNGDYRDLYTTRSTFLSPALAALYQLPATPGWSAYEFPADSPRAGLLTQISFLAVHSHPGRSSPTLRGKALRELMLCQPVPSPPPDVDFTLVENPDADYKTQRDRVGAHLENPVCAGCHKITDPMGLALESFDGAGRYRVTEKGNLIDTSGSIDGVAFDNVNGLSSALRNHPALPSCLVERVYSYGSGRPSSPEDAELLSYFNTRFMEQDYTFPGLLRAIVMSSAFSAVKEPQGLEANAVSEPYEQYATDHNK